MMKAFERALFLAESDTRRRKSAQSLRQIESRLMKNILAQSLALEVIRNSQKPTSQLISELVEIEAKVGEFVGEALAQATAKHKSKIDLRGALAGALSFIPIAPPHRKRPTHLSWRKVALTWVTKVLEEPAKESGAEAFQRPNRTPESSLPAVALPPLPNPKNKARKTAGGSVNNVRGKKRQTKKHRRGSAR